MTVSSPDRRNRIATVCARGGSKGLAGKNGRLLLGKPLLAWSVEQAKQSGLFQTVVVTSDSDALLDAGRNAGADMAIKRPDDLSHDRISKLPAIVHAVHEAETKSGIRYETIVDLDATAPLRLKDDIQGVVDMLEESNLTNVITGSPSRRSPYYNMVEKDENGIVMVCKKHTKPVKFRQDAPDCFDLNASIYAWNREPFLSDPKEFYVRTGIYIMPPERSHDIDSELDFRIVEVMMKHLQGSQDTTVGV